MGCIGLKPQISLQGKKSVLLVVDYQDIGIGIHVHEGRGLAKYGG